MEKHQTTIIIYIVVVVIISISSIHAITLNRTVCIKNGVITDGLISSKTNMVEWSGAPMKGGRCPSNKVLLEPGVIVNNQLVSSKGYCLDSAFVMYGKATSVGYVIELDGTAAGKQCMNEGILLNKGVLLDIVPVNADKSKIFVVNENQRLSNLRYTTRIVNETGCLDGKGVILDALVNIYLLAKADKNGACPTSTLLLESGVIDRGLANQIINSTNECMVTGLVVTGRVLGSGSIVPLNGTLLSGGVCQLDVVNSSLKAMAGPLLLPGVVLIIPNTESINLAVKTASRHGEEKKVGFKPLNLVTFGKKRKGVGEKNKKAETHKGVGGVSKRFDKSPNHLNFNKPPLHKKKHGLNHVSNMNQNYH